MEPVGQGAEGSAMMQREVFEWGYRFKMCTLEWVPAMVFTTRLWFQRQEDKEKEASWMLLQMSAKNC